LLIDIAALGVPFLLVIGFAARGWWRDRHDQPPAGKSIVF